MLWSSLDVTTLSVLGLTASCFLASVDASAEVVGSDCLESMLTLIRRGIKSFVQLHHFRPQNWSRTGF